MTKRRIWWIIGVSLLSLTGLLCFQIYWIKKAVFLQEEHFSHRVHMALWAVRDRVRENGTLGQLTNSTLSVGSPEIAQVDSLLKSSFKSFHVSIPYEFVIAYPTAGSEANFDPYYSCPLTPTLQSKGLELKVEFPDRSVFNHPELNTMLIISLVFVLSVIICFAMTIFTILKQKKVSDVTRDFMNNMTHEFKTPIASIALASKMLRKDAVLEQQEKIKYYSTIICNENNRLQAQVEQVLQMAQLEEHKFVFRKERFCFHELLQEVIDTIQVQILEKKGEVKTDLKACKTVIIGDKTHLGNAIINLIDNANKYCLTKPVIKIMTMIQNDRLIIAIEDNGIGLSKDNQPLIFNRFYRVPTGNVHTVKGFGLGLSYAQMVVKTHNGNIKLKSELGKGSRFEVILPLV